MAPEVINKLTLKRASKNVRLGMCLRAIILGNGGHRSTGYVTQTSAVQLVSKLCTIFDLMTSRSPIKPCKIQDFLKEGADFVNLIGYLEVIRSNNLHN